MTYFDLQPEEVTPKVVGIVGFDGVAALDLTGPLDALARASLAGASNKRSVCYRPVILGLASKRFVSESGLPFKAEATLATAGDLDTIIVPGGEGVRQPETMAILAAWLGERAGQTRRIASISTGIYALARSGLLDGRHVTTHWRFANDIARRFPKLRVNYAAAFLKDGAFYTSGGGNSGVEMTLALIEEDFGNQVAREVAREFVMRLRPMGEADDHFEFTNYQCDPSERVAELPAWILAHLRENLTVEALAVRACLCPRHFSRVFKHVFNCTPADFVEELRLAEARRRLLGLRSSVEDIAGSVGFHSADAFRRAFERRVGMTPSLFRRQARQENLTPRMGSAALARQQPKSASFYRRKLAA
jgi:transcriptional regulator GlxA family with amidase domain